MPAHAARQGAPGSAEYTVGYTTVPAFRAAVAGERATVLRSIPSLRVAQVRAGAEFRVHVAGRPGIRFVERVKQRRMRIEPALQLSSARVPYEWQYAAARVDAVPEWVLRAASSVTIAVVDTGADITAPDLAAKSPLTYNTRTGSADVRDTVGHGTFVAALAAGSVTNGDGVAGFGGDAKLMVIKTGPGDGSFTDVDEAAAITYAVDQGAKIINLSIGGTTTSSTEINAIEYAAARNVLLVAAGGNEFNAGNPVEYPAALLQRVGSKGVGGKGLAVAASTTTGSRASFSNTGSYISLAAPGDGVFSALSAQSPSSRFPRVQLPGSLAGQYGYGSGTSFAAPQVAGVAALVWAANPLLDAVSVAQILKNSASGRGAWNAELGYGVLDAAAAVALATGTPSQVAQAVLRLSGSITNSSVTLNAALASLVPTVSPAERPVAFDVFDAAAASWKQVGVTQTSSNGKASLRFTPKRGTYTLRARWSGAADLAPVVSRHVSVTFGTTRAARRR